ncbi:DUF3576 domain-containing protein [Candidatus Pelagibacter bacterium]|jgi:hypothetical protein|nr:DUF3576 domain-containing protein [Candidatus Pelagibacter bacterium]
MFKNSKLILSFFVFIFAFTSCGNKFGDARKTPTNALERARKNVEEGRGASIGGMLGNRGGTNYEFSSSNPMWRATLETLDFLPLSTVDYSGGTVITDWYSENNSNESIKITVRFLSNEVRSDNLKIIVHKKKCSTPSNCTTSLLKGNKIGSELIRTIVRKAALLEQADKKKKKK